MRITILTPYYPPEMGAPPARLSEVAARLVGYGHRVTVVTALPNRPLGRFYDGYGGRIFRAANEAGVRVLRVWLKPSAASASAIGRTINDLSFVVSAAFLAGYRLGRQDVLLVQSPPLFAALSACWLRARTGARCVLWCGDVWPDVLIESGQLNGNGFMARFMRRLQQFGLRRSAAVALTNPTIVARTKAAYQCPPAVVWSNGVDTNLFKPEQRGPYLRNTLNCSDDCLIIGYVGLHGRFQGLDCIIEAVMRLPGEKVQMVLVGEGVEKNGLIAKVRAAGCTHIHFRDPLPKSAMPELVASCDVSVVSLHQRMPGTMPSKFYEACASGSIPLTADGCEAAPLVRQTGCGVVYEPGDVNSASTALQSVLAQSASERAAMRQAARVLAMRFDRNRQAAYLNSCLQALTAGKPLPAGDW